MRQINGFEMRMRSPLQINYDSRGLTQVLGSRGSGGMRLVFRIFVFDTWLVTSMSLSSLNSKMGTWRVSTFWGMMTVRRLQTDLLDMAPKVSF